MSIIGLSGTVKPPCTDAAEIGPWEGEKMQPAFTVGTRPEYTYTPYTYPQRRGHAQVRERGTPFPYTERHLQCVWSDDAFRPQALTTREGETVQVLATGRWDLEAGPDFLDAALILGDGRRIAGDVEIHIRPRDWDAHGHTGDVRYRRVVAHITYFARQGDAPALPPGCVEICLQPALNMIPQFSFDMIDVSAYPFAAVTPTNPPCAEIIRSWPQAQQAAFLEEAGRCRLETKAQRLATHLPELPPEEIFYRETMRALGYRPNAASFLTLASSVTRADLDRCDTPLDAYALLLGVAGLLPERVPHAWPATSRAFLRQLWDRYWPLDQQWQARKLRPDAWQLASLRPLNNPMRRLAAAATLFHRLPADWEESLLLPTSPRKQATALAEMASPPEASALHFWTTHLSLGRDDCKPTALLGPSRLNTIVTNVLIPLRWALDLAPTESIATKLPPGQLDSHARRAAHALFGRDHNPALYAHNGLRQQGLLQIYHDFCLAHSGICAQSRLPKALEPVDHPKRAG
jgi:hypothetical protein